jgi:putative ABC transport system permease protein
MIPRATQNVIIGHRSFPDRDLMAAPSITTRIAQAAQLDLLAALRSLARSPGYATTVVLSLALALGAGAAAFSVIDAVRFRALPFKDGDRLVVLSEVPVDPIATARPSDSCRTACNISYDTFDQVLRTYPFHALDVVAAYTSGGKALNRGGESILVNGGVVSDNLFDLLGARPYRGRAFSPDDNKLGVPLTTVLSHDMWTTHFGQDPAIIGQVIKLSDSQYTVIGIMPPGFRHESRSDFWLPAVPTLDPSTRPAIRIITAIARLRAGATIDQLRGELSNIDPAPAAGSARGNAPKMRIEATPLRDRYTTSTRSHDLIFAAIVGCVLLIACTNLANLVLVRTLHQQRELAIRVSLGAGVGRLARHLFAQQLVLVVIAEVIGLALASWSLGFLGSLAALNSLRPDGMEYRLDARVVLFAMSLALLAGAFLSLAPARVMSRLDVQRLLREGAPSGGAARWGSRAQQVFVVAQIATAVVLLIGGGLMADTVVHLSRVDVGFDHTKLVQGTPSFPHPWRVRETYMPVSRRILDELSRMPGVGGVALRATLPLGNRGNAPAITLEGRAEPLPAGIAPSSALSVSSGYFEALGVKIVRGRGFTDQDLENSVPVAILNEWAARRWWPGEDPIGRTFRVDTAPSKPVTLTVVGIARDNKAAQSSILLADDAAELYRPFEQASSAFPTFFVRSTGSPAPLLKPARDALVKLVPDRPVFTTLVSDQIAQQLRGVRLNAMQIVGFALVGLLLAVIGIYGVLSHAVGRRTREIGIRGALGATRGGIGAMILRDALALTAIGLAIGLPLATSSSRLINDLLHGTKPTEPVVYVLVALGIVLVSLIASWIPARRAARVDPIVALRSM